LKRKEDWRIPLSLKSDSLLRLTFMNEGIEKQIRELTKPKVEIVDHLGAPANIENYDSFMSFLMLTSINAQAAKIRKYLEDRESRGTIQNFDVLATSPFPSHELNVEPPAQSISLRNDGPPPGSPRGVPGILWIEWNERNSGKTILNPTESCHIKFETHKLKRFYVGCPAGATAMVRAATKG